MTIEAGPKPNGVRTAVTDTRNQKNKSSAPDGQGGGFGSILASLNTLEPAGALAIETTDAPKGSDSTHAKTPIATTTFDSQEESLEQADASSLYWGGMGLEPLRPLDRDSRVETGDGVEKLPKCAFDAQPVTLLPTASPLVVPSQVPVDATALPSQYPQRGTPSTRSDPRENRMSLGIVTDRPAKIDAQIALPKIRSFDATAVPTLSIEGVVETLGTFATSQLEVAENAVHGMTVQAMSGSFEELKRKAAEKSEGQAVVFSIPVEAPLRAVERSEKLQSDLVEQQKGGSVVYGVAIEAPVEMGGESVTLQRDAIERRTLAGIASATPEKSSGQPEIRSLPLIAKIVDETFVPITVTAFAASVLSPVRREDQIRERTVFRSTAEDGFTVGQTLTPTTGSAAVQYTSAMQMAPEVFIAEKVAYWISNDVQHAEMRLDGIGSDPVEVSIRMHGNEAHVAFRTDEWQARAALENASTHLKELLQREGLVLTGVSVENSGTGGAGDKQGRSRQGGRQTSVVSAVPMQADRGVVSRRVDGGSLDLFV
jgi:hypothetical protein